jgi:hypothetical protein
MENLSKYGGLGEASPNRGYEAGPKEPQLQEMARVVNDYVQEAHDWYQRKKRLPRQLYRVTIATTVILSSSVPFLASFEGRGFRLAVGVIGVIIAVVTGLGGFYRWETTWQVFALAQADLEYALRVWELRMAEADSKEEHGARLALAKEATQEVMEEGRRVRASETEEFFRGVMRPQR